jgi:hypothetical protein
MPGRRFLIIAAAFLFIVFFSANPAPGQSYEAFAAARSSIVSRAKLKIGPFYIIPGIEIGLGHDNNIYGISNFQGPVQDYAVSLSIPLSAHWPAGDWLILSFAYAPAYEYYFQIDTERAFNSVLSLGARLLLFRRFPISGGYQYSRIKSRFSSEVDQRVFQESKGYYWGIHLDTVGGASAGLSGSIIDLSYENVNLSGSDISLSRALDRTEKNVRFEIYYPIFSDSQFFANFGYTDYVFANPEGGFRNSYSYQSYMGVRFPLLGRARGNIAVGYKKFIPSEEGESGFSGLVGNTNAELRLGRVSLRAKYVRDIPFSYGGGIFYVNSGYGAGISVYLSQSLRLDYDFGYGGGEYPEPQEVVLPGKGPELIKRKDIYTSHGVGIVFRILRNTGLGLRADIVERRSNLVLENMNRTFIGMYITFDF